jgi:hypothetical protein
MSGLNAKPKKLTRKDQRMDIEIDAIVQEAT